MYSYGMFMEQKGQRPRAVRSVWRGASSKLFFLGPDTATPYRLPTWELPMYIMSRPSTKDLQ